MELVRRKFLRNVGKLVPGYTAAPQKIAPFTVTNHSFRVRVTVRNQTGPTDTRTVVPFPTALPSVQCGEGPSHFKGIWRVSDTVTIPLRSTHIKLSYRQKNKVPVGSG
jgi:hypothetical protein